MGPLAVRVDRQGGGIGKTIVRAATEWLLDRGVTTLGLETMPRTVENIGFYARLGYVPGYLTITMTRDIATRGHAAPSLLSEQSAADRERQTAAIRRLIADLVGGPDFTREVLLTQELGLGDTTLIAGADGLDAAVLWHSASLAEGRAREEVRILKLAARDERAFSAALTATEAAAARAGIRRVAVRCQTRYEAVFRQLVERGYRVRWTDLRMTLDGYEEPHARTGVVFSNWEI